MDPDNSMIIEIHTRENEILNEIVARENEILNEIGPMRE